MNIHNSFRRVAATVTAAIALIAPPTIAQQMDMDAMVKWSSAAVIHYKVVGDYAGEGVISAKNAAANQNGGVMAKFTDRIEIELDFQQRERKIIGTPIIRNSPTTLGPIQYEKRCPAPKLDGAFEFGTLTAVKHTTGMPMLKLELTRDLVGGDIHFMAEGCGMNKVVPQSAAFTKEHTLTIAMMMAMPAEPGTRTPDGKSVITKDPSGDGWVWTTTMTIK